MKSKLKLTILTFALLIFGGIAGAVDTHAQTISFNLTPASGSPKWSDAAEKNASSYENCCYVTPTYFGKTGSIGAKSYSTANSAICTGTISISSGGVNVGRSSYYVQSAPAGSGKTYKLKVTFGSAASGSSIQVKGRYTP